MIRIVNILLCLLIYVIAASCNKEWFNEKASRNQIVPSTVTDLEQLLDNIFVMNAFTPGLTEIASDGHYTPDDKLISLSNSESNNAMKNAYTWSRVYPYLQIHDWNYGYQKIFYANVVLDGLRRIQPKSDELDQYNSVRGNALFHRAKAYFDLAQEYAMPFKKESASSDLGLALTLNADVTKNAIRSSVSETYEQIISDLMLAKDLLPLNPKFKTRGSKVSALALLAKVYLTMGNWEQALLFSDSTLKFKNDLLDFNEIPETNPTLGIFNKEVIFHCTMSNWGLVFVPTYILIDTNLYNKYDKNDLRKTRFFENNAGEISFKGTYNQDILPFSGIATDEVYLIRSEAFVRDHQLSKGLDDLNYLLRTRWNRKASYVNYETSDEVAALRKILEEREKELLLRGIRWSDLRRLNLEQDFKKSIKRVVGNETYILDPNSYKYTFPIPDDEISLSGITQSPGWQ